MAFPSWLAFCDKSDKLHRSGRRVVYMLIDTCLTVDDTRVPGTCS